MISQNDKRFRNPAWIILVLGIVLDFILAVMGKTQTITIINYGVIPTFTTGTILIFLILNFIPQAKKYLDSKSK